MYFSAYVYVISSIALWTFFSDFERYVVGGEAWTEEREEKNRKGGRRNWKRSQSIRKATTGRIVFCSCPTLQVAALINWQTGKQSKPCTLDSFHLFRQSLYVCLWVDIKTINLCKMIWIVNWVTPDIWISGKCIEHQFHVLILWQKTLHKTMAGGSAAKKLIQIDIISDTVCPWCFVGKKNLDKALEASRDRYDFEVIFFLVLVVLVDLCCFVLPS